MLMISSFSFMSGGVTFEDSQKILKKNIYNAMILYIYTHIMK